MHKINGGDTYVAFSGSGDLEKFELGRSLSSMESSWEVLEFQMFFRSPPVECVNVHIGDRADYIGGSYLRNGSERNPSLLDLYY